jgi:hypothetical protein
LERAEPPDGKLRWDGDETLSVEGTSSKKGHWYGGFELCAARRGGVGNKRD